MTILDLYIGGTPPTLIRYQILFIKPGFEVAFPEMQELVANRIRLLEFSGFELFRFFSESATGSIRRPVKWVSLDYPPSNFVKAEDKVFGGESWRLPEDDWQYLTFHCDMSFQGRRLHDLDITIGANKPTVLRYRFLFTKPQFEHVFPEMEDILTKERSLFEFAGTAIVDFMMQIGRHHAHWPIKWRANSYPAANKSGDWSTPMLSMLPECDWAYLQFDCDATSRSETEVAATIQSEERPSATPCVFIGHGHSLEWLKLQEFLEKKLHLRIVEFNSEPSAGLSTQQRLQDMAKADFAFLVMTAEEERVAGDGNKFPRDNVIHEVGFFQGKLGFRKAIPLVEEGCAGFSNILGLGQIPFPKGDILARSQQIRDVLVRERIIGP
jgi:predicted nucleotide-binding protein